MKKNKVPFLSKLARQKKIDYFLKNLDNGAAILEIGCGEGWLKEYFINNGYHNYTGIDLNPPADIVGDIKNYKLLGMKRDHYDLIIAFEVLEHIDCIKECHDLLKPGGRLVVSTPLPHADWFLEILEKIGLNQKRTSPHNNLIYLDKISQFRTKRTKIIGFLSQWGIFIK